MQNPFRSKTDPKLQALIDDVIVRMNDVTVDSPEYPELLTQLERLNELKTKNRPMPVSRDTMVIALANLAGILVIVGYEHAHVVTSKALGQIRSPGPMH